MLCWASKRVDQSLPGGGLGGSQRAFSRRRYEKGGWLDCAMDICGLSLRYGKVSGSTFVHWPCSNSIRRPSRASRAQITTLSSISFRPLRPGNNPGDLELALIQNFIQLEYIFTKSWLRSRPLASGKSSPGHSETEAGGPADGARGHVSSQDTMCRDPHPPQPRLSGP